jgi:uncharacterized membrane protein YcaP (DUF421 family)
MESVILVIITYFAIMIGIRILGKREFSQLSTIELVALLMIPELVSNAVQRGDYSITDALIAVATLLTLVFLTSALTHVSPKASKLVGGTPIVLVHHGELVPNNLHKERVSPEEIFSEIHKTGLERLEQVRWAILETDGKISVVPEDIDDRWKRGKANDSSLKD